MNTVDTLPTEIPIGLTPKAIEMAKKKLLEAEETVIGLRVGVRGGGCSGYSYVFDFAKDVRDGRDSVLEFDGLKIIIDKKSLEFLKGSTLDWEQKLIGYGFKWLNPNATGSCGCGESFNV